METEINQIYKKQITGLKRVIVLSITFSLLLGFVFGFAVGKLI